MLRLTTLSLLSVLLLPVVAKPAAIQITGNTVACPVGDCTSAGLQSSALGNGQSVPLTPFSFTYTASSTDQFKISGEYSSSLTNFMPTLFTAFSATYTGNNGVTLAADSFTLNLLQDFNGGGPGNWNSPPPYNEHVPVIVGNFTTFSANTCYDTSSCIGELGPLGPGTYNENATASLGGLTGQYLDEDFQFTFNFAKGAPSGTQDVVLASAVPEPAQTVPVALGLAGFATLWVIRKRGAKDKPALY